VAKNRRKTAIARPTWDVDDTIFIGKSQLEEYKDYFEFWTNPGLSCKIERRE
jgi:hypothetical protein